MDFLLGFEGLKASETAYEMPFTGNVTYRAHTVAVTERVRCPEGGIAVADFEFLAAATTRTAKLCIPAPAMIRALMETGSSDSAIYADPDEAWSDLALAYTDAIAAYGEAGCTYLQMDDVNSAMLADPNRQAFWRSLGHEPLDLLESFIQVNNAAVRSRPKPMTVVVHMCRGNFQSQWIGAGGYDVIAERYFSLLDVDGFFLEYDDERSGGFEPLRFIPEGKTVVLGIMTSKSPKLEAKDQLKRRIDEAAKYVPLENLCISPQCGFASTHEGNRLTEDEQYRKLEHLVEVAEEVWGAV